MQESIYNIIPKEYASAPKDSLYKSKYPHNIPPTGSTFCHKTTSKPGVSNLSGNFDVGLQVHTQYGKTKTFGHLKGDCRPSPQNFRKKHTGTMGNETLPQPRNFSFDCRNKKPPVPKVHEKPIQGLKSQKNFIVSNAIQNILSVAKKNPESTDWLKKRHYGQTPAYIERIKENINNQYRMIQSLHQESQEKKKKKVLSEEQIREIRQGLKRKWNELNQQYQKITHIRLVDTIGLKRKKQGLEKEMAVIEKDIKNLNKLYVFIDQ